MTLNSKLSRRLANVRVQLKTGRTRGPNPRCLSPEEVEALEARRDQLQAEMADRQRHEHTLVTFAGMRGRAKAQNLQEFLSPTGAGYS